MIKGYQPIDCNFHDKLLDRATRKSKVMLEYDHSNGRQKEEVVFKDVYTKDGEEFLLTENGMKIRLDQIVSIDGEKPPQKNCC